MTRIGFFSVSFLLGHVQRMKQIDATTTPESHMDLRGEVCYAAATSTQLHAACVFLGLFSLLVH